MKFLSLLPRKLQKVSFEQPSMFNLNKIFRKLFFKQYRSKTNINLNKILSNKFNNMKELYIISNGTIIGKKNDDNDLIIIDKYGIKKIYNGIVRRKEIITISNEGILFLQVQLINSSIIEIINLYDNLKVIGEISINQSSLVNLLVNKNDIYIKVVEKINRNEAIGKIVKFNLNELDKPGETVIETPIVSHNVLQTIFLNIGLSESNEPYLVYCDGINKKIKIFRNNGVEEFDFVINKQEHIFKIFIKENNIYIYKRIFDKKHQQINRYIGKFSKIGGKINNLKNEVKIIVNITDINFDKNLIILSIDENQKEDLKARKIKI